MRSWTTFLCLCAVLAGGCRANHDAVVTSGSRAFDGTTAHYYAARDGHVIFILWHDLKPDDPGAGSFTSGSSGQDGKSVKVDSEWRSTDGKTLRWTCRWQDGAGGTVAINGSDYDLAGGGLFVVADGPDGPVVTQVAADLGRSDAIVSTLNHLMKQEPAVRALTGGRS